MRLPLLRIAAIAACILGTIGLQATPAGEPGSCPSDSKLLNGGPTLVFGEGSGTFWGLIIDGLNAAGLDLEAEKISYLNNVFGTSFATLGELETFNLQVVSEAWDKNQNGYICAYELRGTRAHFDDPLINLTYFGISDDRIRKN